jgi:16S rRNA processing protein RimM
VAFDGVASREAAEGLREAVLSAPPVEVEGALWVHRMVGADLYDPAGEVVGKIEAVEANPASDLLILADGRVVPLTFVDTVGGRLVVDGPAGLLDPA